jgi:hypothetical protein
MPPIDVVPLNQFMASSHRPTCFPALRGVGPFASAAPLGESYRPTLIAKLMANTTGLNSRATLPVPRFL